MKLNEEVNPSFNVERGLVGVNVDAVRDNINILLNGVTNCSTVTPYIALERVRKVLAQFHIFLPKVTFMEGDHGIETWETNQFGEVMGMRDDGSVASKVPDPYHVYFEYQLNERGMFDIFCEIVNQDELEDLMNEVEAELNDDEPDEEKKAVNEANEEIPTKKIKYRKFLGVSPSKGNYDAQWNHSEKMNPYHETKQNLKSFKRFAQSEFRNLRRKRPADFDEYKKGYMKHQDRINDIIKLLGKIKAQEKAEKLKKSQ